MGGAGSSLGTALTEKESQVYEKLKDEYEKLQGSGNMTQEQIFLELRQRYQAEMGLPILHKHTTEEVGKAAAEYIAALSASAINETGRFTIALSGGSMPKLLGAGFSSMMDSIDFSKWHVFFSDERCVGLEDADSNYKACADALFSKVNIPRSQIYCLDPSLAADPAAAAAAYDQHLTAVFGSKEMPRFDLIMLGMGPDGHTASLFPGHPLLQETQARVSPITDSPKPPPTRITLTLPLLNNAKQVAFLATGASKAPLLPAVFSVPGTASTPMPPAGLVRPTNGALHWFVDVPAAAQLQ